MNQEAAEESSSGITGLAVECSPGHECLQIARGC